MEIENEIVNVNEVIINIPFDDFWNIYDKKTGDKAKTLKKWFNLKDEERTAIMEYVPKYKIAQPEKQYRKNPETFLYQRGWEHELIYKNGQPAERKQITLN